MTRLIRRAEAMARSGYRATQFDHLVKIGVLPQPFKRHANGRAVFWTDSQWDEHDEKRKAEYLQEKAKRDAERAAQAAAKAAAQSALEPGAADAPAPPKRRGRPRKVKPEDAPAA